MKDSLKKVFEMITDMFSSKSDTEDSVVALLENAKNEIREIRTNMDHVNDDELLDMYIYRLKAAQAQYRHLLKMAKESNSKKTG